jgi:hypothetical protein
MSLASDTPEIKPHGATSLPRELILRLRGRRELAELAQDLLQRGISPFGILMEVHRRFCQMRLAGTPLAPDAALAVVRALPGLAEWDAMDTWQKGVEAADPHALADGIEVEVISEQIQERRRRAGVLSTWLTVHADSPLTEQMVAACEGIAAHDAESASCPEN